MKRIKCVFMGSPTIGKTDLIRKFMYNDMPHWPNDSVTTTYDVDVVFNEQKRVSFRLFDYDMDESDESQCLREEEIEDIDVLILCYSNSSTESKMYMRNAFRKRIRSSWRRAYRVLIGMDSRPDREMINEIQPNAAISLPRFNDLNDLFIRLFKTIEACKLQSQLIKSHKLSMIEVSLKTWPALKIYNKNVYPEFTVLKKINIATRKSLRATALILLVFSYLIMLFLNREEAICSRQTGSILYNRSNSTQNYSQSF